MPSEAQRCGSPYGLKHVNGCGSSSWADRLAPLALASPVMINIGANTGYAMVEFLGRFSANRTVTPAAWHAEIRRYAELTKSGNLKWTSCGACKQCRSPGGRSRRSHDVGGAATAHALELDLKTRLVLRHVANATGAPMTVHELAAADKPGRACAAPSTLAGFEQHAITSMRAAEGQCGRGQSVEAVTIDELMGSLGLSAVEHLSMDTEGWDAKILYAGRRSVARRAFRIIEFEYHARWKEHRTSLHAVQEWLFAAGYHCFFISKKPNLLLPLSGACWRAAYEFYKWSNVVCAHEREYLNVLYAMDGRKEDPA